MGKPPIVVAFSNQKGGVGKTTSCIQAAFHLAVKRKKKILVIDFDSQGNSSSRVLLRGEDGQVMYPDEGTRVIDLFDPDLAEIKPTPGQHGIDLIYTINNDETLADIEAAALERAIIPAKHMRAFLATAQYDYVLVDCPPTLGRRLVAALSFTDKVVVPIKVSGFAVEGVEALLTTVSRIQQSSNPYLEVAAFFINDMDSKSIVHARAREHLQAAVGDMLLKNVILHRPPIDTATSEGVPVWSLGYAHAASKEVAAVFDEMLKRIDK